MHQLKKIQNRTGPGKSCFLYNLTKKAINRILQLLNRIRDFNYVADEVVYQVKKRGKNMCLLNHDIKDLNNPDIKVMKMDV